MTYFTIIIVILGCLLTSVTCIQFGTQVSNPNEYPFYIMIGNPHVCGGALLSYDPPYVLTAAHCVADAPSRPSDHGKDDNPYFAGYYHVNRKHQRTTRIVDWFVHPSYNVSNTVDMNYDVAIVKLESPLSISRRIRRVALWSSEMTSSIPMQGDLVGFGYTNLEKAETQDMQKLKLNITRFIPNDPKMMVEARSEKEEEIACHGDSGSPLIVHHSVAIPDSDQSVTVPFVAGNLARIFGAYDQSPQILTCPVPFVPSRDRNGTLNSVVESFCNTASMLDWISSVVGISKQNLSDPFYVPPHPPCRNCRKIYNSGNVDGDLRVNGLSGDEFMMDYDGDDEEEEVDGDHEWHIGVIADNSDDDDDDGLIQDEEEPENFWIGPVIDYLQIGKTTSKGDSIYHYTHLYIFITSFLSFISYIIHS